MADPMQGGRKPTDGPGVTREEINRRQAAQLNQTDNGELEQSRKKPWVTPEKSAK